MPKLHPSPWSCSPTTGQLPSQRRTGRKTIEEALEACQRHQPPESHLPALRSASADLSLIQPYYRRISIFHFAGHAGGKELQLNKRFFRQQKPYAGGLVSCSPPAKWRTASCNWFPQRLLDPASTGRAPGRRGAFGDRHPLPHRGRQGAEPVPNSSTGHW